MENKGLVGPINAAEACQAKLNPKAGATLIELMAIESNRDEEFQFVGLDRE